MDEDFIAICAATLVAGVGIWGLWGGRRREPGHDRNRAGPRRSPRIETGLHERSPYMRDRTLRWRERQAAVEAGIHKLGIIRN